MNAVFIDILKKLTAEQGKEALLNPAKCKALLADYTKGEYKKESRLLLQAIDAGVQKAIDTTSELAICKKQQVRVLVEELFINVEAAADVVDTLALVLKGEQDETPQSAFCANCGKELQKEWKSCPYCSTPVAKTSQAASSAISSGSGGGGYDASLINNENKIKEYTEAIRLNPDNADAYIGRGDAYEEAGQYDMAIKDYTEAIRLNPRNVNGYLKRAGCYHIAHMYADDDGFLKDCTEAAIRDYTEAIRLDPSNADAYIRRGTCYSKTQYDMAVKDFTEAIRLNPNDELGYRNRGFIYFEKAEYDMAIKDFTEAIRLNPNNGVAYYCRGEAYHKIAQYDLAIRNYTEAIRLGSYYVPSEPYQNRGNAYYMKNQYDVAIKDYNEVIKLSPNNTDAYCWRGQAYRQLGQINQAIQDFEKALSLDPNIYWVKQQLRKIQGLQLPVVDGQVLKTNQLELRRAKGLFSFERGNLFLCKDRLEWKGKKDNIVIPIEKISSVKSDAMSGGFKITLDNNTEYIFYYPAGTCTVEEAKQDKASWISAIDDVRNGILG